VARREPAGFSLIELMVVLVVLSVLTALVVPQFGGTYSDAVLRASARKLIAVLQLAYSQAVTTGRVHRVQLDTETCRYWLEAPRPDGDRQFAPVTNVTGAAGLLDPRIRMRLEVAAAGRDRTAPILTFRPDGTATACEVHLHDREGFAVVVRVDPVTSRVRVSDIRRGGAP
jgi:general secretion pathway protein H